MPDTQIHQSPEEYTVETVPSRADLVEHDMDLLRDIRFDQTDLYAFRQNDVHVIVGGGESEDDQWVTTVPAERDGIVIGEELWTVPDNWQLRVSVDDSLGDFEIWEINDGSVSQNAPRPENHDSSDSQVYVMVALPSNSNLMEQRYIVSDVGNSIGFADDSLDYVSLEESIQTALVRDVSETVLKELEHMLSNIWEYNSDVRAHVEPMIEDAVFLDDARSAVSADNKTIKPWVTPVQYDTLLDEWLADLDSEDRDTIEHLLDEFDVVPKHPEVTLHPHGDVPDTVFQAGVMEHGFDEQVCNDYLLYQIDGIDIDTIAEERDVDAKAVKDNIEQVQKVISS